MSRAYFRHGSRLEIAYMRQYDDLVLGEMDVRLDGMCAYVDGGTEGTKGVFRIRRFVTSVSDRLR